MQRNAPRDGHIKHLLLVQVEEWGVKPQCSVAVEVERFLHGSNEGRAAVAITGVRMNTQDDDSWTAGRQSKRNMYEESVAPGNLPHARLKPRDRDLRERHCQVMRQGASRLGLVNRCQLAVVDEHRLRFPSCSDTASRSGGINSPAEEAGGQASRHGPSAAWIRERITSSLPLLGRHTATIPPPGETPLLGHQPDGLAAPEAVFSGRNACRLDQSWRRVPLLLLSMVAVA